LGAISCQINKARDDANGACDVIRGSDEQRMAPGTEVLKKVLGDGPTLVMLDVITGCLRVAKATSVGENQVSNLAEQMVALPMLLREYALNRLRA
jgi:hypothetical protein